MKRRRKRRKISEKKKKIREYKTRGDSLVGRQFFFRLDLDCEIIALFFWAQGGFEGNVFVETTLVDVYSKFGCMGIAWQFFESMSERNVAS